MRVRCWSLMLTCALTLVWEDCAVLGCCAVPSSCVVVLPGCCCAVLPEAFGCCVIVPAAGACCAWLVLGGGLADCCDDGWALAGACDVVVELGGLVDPADCPVPLGAGLAAWPPCGCAEFCCGVFCCGAVCCVADDPDGLLGWACVAGGFLSAA